MTRFADPADEASHREEEFIQQALDNARHAAGPPLPFTGRCHNCGGPLEGPNRFCDEYCMADWERIEKAKKRNGLRG